MNDCVRHELDGGDGACPTCGHVRRVLPDWAVPGVVLGVDGIVYRVGAIGSTNCRTHLQSHFEDCAIASEIGGPSLRLPAEGSPTSALDVFLSKLKSAKRLFADDLNRSLRVA